MQRRFGSETADLFAIPKANDEGDRVDWYAPQPGMVVPWASASVDERKAARTTLLRARDRITKTAKNIQDNDVQDDQKQIFGRLLEQALQFPDDDHVYLVDGRPVITFWGFRRHNAIPESNAFMGLYIENAPPPGLIATPGPGMTSARRRGSHWWWLLLPLLLVPLLFWRGCDDRKPHSLQSASVFSEAKPLDQPKGVPTSEIDPDSSIRHAVPATRVIDRDAVGSATPSDGGRIHGQPIPGGAAESEAWLIDESDVELPPRPGADQDLRVNEEAVGAAPQSFEDEILGSERTDAAVEGETESEENARVGEPHEQQQPQDDAVNPEEQGEELTIPPEALESGSTDFLNGRWRSSTGLMEADTGRPVVLEYAFRNGKGQARIRRSDGTVCTGDVSATLRDKRLVLNNSIVRCPDGAGFNPVKVECGIGKTSSSDCSGEQSEGGRFTVKMRQTKTPKTGDE